MPRRTNGSDKGQVPAISFESRPESLTRSVLDTIRSAIVDKSLPAGTRVTEASLAEQLNVSKTPVREALLELRQAGLIEDWGRRGGRIVSPSVRLLRDISETREALEVFLAGQVAVVASASQRKSLLDIAMQAMEAAQSGDSRRFHEINTSFYVSLADILENNMIRELIKRNFTLGAALRLRDYPGSVPLTVLAEGLRSLANAVVEGPPRRAEDEARKRVRLSLEYNLSAFSQHKQQTTASSAPPDTGIGRRPRKPGDVAGVRRSG